MSSTAQGVTAVKQCRFPPLFGYKTDVPCGAIKTSSTANLANLTAKYIHSRYPVANHTSFTSFANRSITQCQTISTKNSYRQEFSDCNNYKGDEATVSLVQVSHRR